MHAANDAETCMRRGRKLCNYALHWRPMWTSWWKKHLVNFLFSNEFPKASCNCTSRYSIWYFFISIITKAYDSNAFFHDLAIGANANTAGAIAVLLAADALSKVPSSLIFLYVIHSLRWILLNLRIKSFLLFIQEKLGDIWVFVYVDILD